eukprot:229267-Prorocentrum_minimum.AAC.1
MGLRALISHQWHGLYSVRQRHNSIRHALMSKANKLIKHTPPPAPPCAGVWARDTPPIGRSWRVPPTDGGPGGGARTDQDRPIRRRR